MIHDPEPRCLLRPKALRSAIPAAGKAKVRLLCFPYAGGAPSAFFGWPELLAPEVDVIWIQSRGRGARFLETPFNRVSDMVQEIATALSSLDETPETPFCFYGHSLGALVAYEVARSLKRSGHPGPAHLFLGAARAPQLERILPSLGHLSDKGFIDAIQSRYSGIPAAILEDPEMMQLFLPILRADFAAYEGYAYLEENPLDCAITTFTGADDPVVTADSMAAWGQHTSGSFAIHVLPGDHFFLTSCRDRLVQTVRHALLNAPSRRDDRRADFVPSLPAKTSLTGIAVAGGLKTASDTNVRKIMPAHDDGLHV